MIGTLLIARHHESEWNKEGRWTGAHDSHLTVYGFQKSQEMGDLIKDIHIDCAFASMQVRSIETLSCMLEGRDTKSISVEYDAAFNERDYGDYTGKNKWEMEKLLGEEQFNHIRRDWDCPVPHGETLKMVYERAVAHFVADVLPRLREGKNALIVSHGNALRALEMYIERIPPEDAPKVEMLFGGIIIYTLDEQGHSLTKEVRQVSSQVNA